MDDLLKLVAEFFRDAEANGVDFFNEAELQHELGYWLRTKLPSGTHVYFERPADSFTPNARGLVKREIDLVVSPADRSWNIAIELKCPRNGRIPETMFDACRDLQMLEQLVAAGFLGGLFVMHVDDPGFYQSGNQTGIYSFFRAGQPLAPVITKPTGSKDQVVNLQGAYRVHWQPYRKAAKYWLQMVTTMPNVTPHMTRAATFVAGTSRLTVVAPAGEDSREPIAGVESATRSVAPGVPTQSVGTRGGVEGL